MNSRSKLEKYVRIKAPDKEALADLVVRAKGSRRSLRQFADELGVNVSTLSRIVNKKIASANSDSLIADIADHADADSNVTFEMLMEAHGMALKEKIRGHHMIDLEREVQAIIVKELIRRNYIVNNSTRWKRAISLDSILGKCYFDFELHTNALGKDDSVWIFDFKAPTRNGSDYTDRQINLIRQWLLMYAGMLCFNEGKVDRLSLVITDRVTYDRIVYHLEGYKMRYGMSVLLVDLERGIVAEEYVIGSENTDKPVFFQIPDEDDFLGSEMGDFENAVVIGDEFIFELQEKKAAEEDN